MSVLWHQKSNNKVNESFAHIEFNASLTISSTNCPKSVNIHITKRHSFIVLYSLHSLYPSVYVYMNMRITMVELDADGYADLFGAEVKRVLDIRASTTADTYRTRRAKPSSSVGVLNVGTVEPAYSQTARESILKSRAVIVKSELDEAAGDVRATWRTAQRLLHTRHKGCV